MTEPRAARFPRILGAYPVLVAAAASLLVVLPKGIGGTAELGALLYIGVVAGVVTAIADRLLRSVFNRLPAPAPTYVIVPLIATLAGVAAGWWAVNNTMGGPV